jgi:NDP-sugar pyrophosphorylase family protein
VACYNLQNKMRTRLTITLKDTILSKVDSVVDSVKIRNRSHAIEFLLNKAFYSEETQAIILCGGEGTRMRPLTYEIPKSLLPLKGKPLLFYLLKLLRENNIKDVIIASGAQTEKIKEKFGEGERLNVEIQYSKEEKNLGTGGAILKAKEKIKSSQFLVLHGDIVADIDIRALLSYHQQTGGIVTMALKVVKETKDFGQILLNGNYVTRFYQSQKKSQSNLVNSGIYVCNQEIYNYFPNQKVFNFDDVITKMIDKRLVTGYVFDGVWFDVETTEEYEKVIKALRSAKKF